MGVYVKIGALGGGYWREATSGNVRVKKPWESVWTYPTYAYAKIGGIGGGYWRDTGYRGLPTAPSAPWVEAWGEFNYTYVRFNPSSGGAPISYYRVYQLNSSGQYVTHADVSAIDQYGRWLVLFQNMGADWHNQYYVEAFAASGLSARSPGYLNVRMGHPRQTAVRDIAKSESWNSPLTSVNLYLQNYVHAVWVPADVAVSSWYWNLRNEQAGWAKLSPGTNRSMVHVFANAPQWGATIDMSNPSSGWFSYVYWGQNNGWGFAIDGTGYSVGSTGSYRIYGEFQIWGTRHWTEQETYETVAYAGNTSWMT